MAALAFVLLVALPTATGGSGHVDAATPPADGEPATEAEPAPTDQEETRTWSVRPTPTEEEPDRPNFAFDLEPGTRVDDSVRVRNFGAAPLPLAVYATDALTTSTGVLDLLPAGEEPTGVGTWIVLERSVVEVPPDDFIDIPFTLIVPPNAESGDHSGGIITSFQTPGNNADGQPVVVDRRLANRVHIRVGGELAPALEVSDVEVDYAGTANPVGTGEATVTYTVTNTGNVRVGATQTIVVPGRFGLPGREAQLADMGELLPGNSLTYTATVPDVWPTIRTTVRVELQPIPIRPDDVFDDPTVAVGEVSVWAVPWTVLALIVAAIGLPLWSWWTRKRRTRRQAEQMQQAVQTAVMVQQALQTSMQQPTTNGGGGPVPFAPPADSPVAGTFDVWDVGDANHQTGSSDATTRLPTTTTQPPDMSEPS